MGRVYKNPPVVEALCEFHFDQSSPWDVTIFGHYYDRIQKEFHHKRQVPQVEMSLEKRERGMMGEIREKGVRMQFMRPDRSAMVQLAPHLLVVNKLHPYESWRVFKTLILARLANYKEVVSTVLLQQIGLRYINRFDFPLEGFAVGTAFGFSEFLPDRLRQAIAPFFLRLEMPQDKEERLMLTMGSIDSESPDRVSVLLDLDYQIIIAAELDEAVLSEYLDKAHDHIEEVFESCLTDELRERFNREV
jgi:uncharacterized protein (TIGR04255 family)